MSLSALLASAGRGLRLRLLPSQTLLGLGSAASPAAATAAAAGARSQQTRGLISVEVHRDNTEGAMRLLNRRLKEEGYLQRFQNMSHRTAPDEKRKIAKKESARRLERKKYKRMLSFVMDRKQRGF